MTSKKKCMLVLPSLGKGGAERVFSFLFDNLNKNQFETRLVVLGSELKNQYHPKNKNLIYLNNKRVLFSIISLYKEIKEFKPDVIFGTIGNVNALLGWISLFYKRSIFIGREASIPSVIQQNSKKFRKFQIPEMKFFTYNLLDYIVCQSEDMFKDLAINYKVKSKKLVIIGNPITSLFELKKNYSETEPTIRLVTVGRLVQVKGYNRIINSLSRLKIDFTYTIIGSGPEKNATEKLINSAKLQDKVNIIPITNKVEYYLAKSDLFLQGSYVEGFPNALLESCAVGTPVLAFNVPGGTKEIVVEGENGYLVKSEEEMAEKIEAFNANRNLFKPQKVRDSVIRRYNEQKILSRYEELLSKEKE